MREKTPFACPERVRRQAPVEGFHILMVLSSDPLAKLPSGRRAKDRTQFECPERVRSQAPVEGFHILMVLSLDPLTKVPLGRKQENSQHMNVRR